IGPAVGAFVIERLAFFSQLIGKRHQRQARAAVISGVLALGEQAILLYARLGNLPSVLVRYALAALVVLLGVGRRPPVAQISLGVELAPLVVEAVGDLMADHRAGAPEVNGIVHVGVKVRRLQNAGRKIDGVELGIVIGVDSGRSHGPLATIYRLADLVQPAMKFEVARLVDILQEAPAPDFHAGVIAPAVGI